MRNLKTNFLILYSLFLILVGFGLAQNSHAATMNAISCSREQITVDPLPDSEEISTSSGKCILTPDVGRENEIISGAPKRLGMIEGAQNTLIVACNFTNTVFPVTLSQINDIMFGDTNSVKSFYAEASFGHVSFTGRVIGIYNIPYRNDDSNYAYFDWSNAALQLVIADGMDFSQYNRIVYVFPSSPFAPNGAAQLSGMVAWVMVPGATYVYAHELGHTLGFNHASTPSSTYGDASDVMGSAGLVHFNGPFKVLAGWVPESRIIRITGSGTYTISLLEQDVSSPQVIMFPKTDTNDKSYYLSYRVRFGYDTALDSTYYDKTSIHYFNGLGEPTFFVGAVGDGDTYQDPVNKITIIQLSHTAQTATVRVTFEDSIPAAPSNLVARVTSPSQIDLSWQDNSSDEDGFRIERSSYSTGPFIFWGKTPANTKSFTDLTSSVRCVYYRVSAYNGAGYSITSNIASVPIGDQCDTTPPASPSGLHVN